LNKGLVVSKVEKNKGLGYKTSKYGILSKHSRRHAFFWHQKAKKFRLFECFRAGQRCFCL